MVEFSGVGHSCGVKGRWALLAPTSSSKVISCTTEKEKGFQLNARLRHSSGYGFYTLRSVIRSGTFLNTRLNISCASSTDSSIA